MGVIVIIMPLLWQMLVLILDVCRERGGKGGEGGKGGGRGGGGGRLLL